MPNDSSHNCITPVPKYLNILSKAQQIHFLLFSPFTGYFECFGGVLAFTRIPLKGGALSPSVDVFSLARRSKSSERRHFKEEDPLGGSRDA